MIRKKKQKQETLPEKGMRILFADDEPTLQELMHVELSDMGHQVTICPDGLTACAALDRNSYDCMLVDLDMPGMNGIEVIQHAKNQNPEIEAIVLTGKSSLETAVAALRQGVFDYLTKPCKLVELKAVFERVKEKIELNRQLKALRRRLNSVEGQPEMVGSGEGIEKVKKLISKVAKTEATVMIRGETGTGKELAARAVHDQSPRCEKPFVAVNCGALPEHLGGLEADAFDITVEMLEVARGRGLYRNYIEGDMTQPLKLDNDSYGAVISCFSGWEI